ncbi:hypothetical protein AGDE_15390 [Angomonas deanei]|uniref:Uncharacterized protein n=1 Tax=Angomonas deanei TaxID=59799 RepID=A0A7G2C0Y3_9TRYP|nr:hypothetical protein AGDE_15390 [Angomonas deanei]CAD2212851.1 hypothetical protein, conserved [Angomonas deanei]|eukprot:EPY19168.1 hypothetical protein AGDE_15390 [Angomonas deanei]
MLVRQEKAARAREEARRRADEEEQRVREVALARQREVEKRLEEFERERQEKRLTRAREEEEKEQRRELARLKEEQKEEEFKAKVIRTQQEHEAAYAEAQKERELELALRKEKEREEIEEKLYAVRKKKRVDEFCKLRTTADLFEKRKAADAVEEQRNLIYEKMMTERKLLNEERDQLKKTISEQQQIC